MSIYKGTHLISGVVTPVQGARNIGQIIPSTIPLTDAGLHLLDGALINGSGIYSAFVDYIADLYDSGDYTAIFETEANWQTAVTTYGVCGKFVYDSVNNTVRLPKYSNKIYTSSLESTAPTKGTGMSLGLTDGTNNFGIKSINYSAATGVVRTNPGLYDVPVGQASSVADVSYNSAFGVTTDSTKSGIITDLSNITTSLDGYYYIVIATTTKTEIEVDIDEVVTDLNTKADIDLSNIPTSKGILVESYKSGASWYRIYSDGWCEQGSFSSPVSADYQVCQITFLKPFTNTDYYFNPRYVSTSWVNAVVGVVADKNRSTSSVYIWNYSTYSSGAYWYACGYIR